MANLAADRGASHSPRKRRTWYFSGFAPGQPIYAHFRYKGKTQANYLMGVAQGPCGTLTKKAPGIVARRLHTGTWTIQVDQAKHYGAKTTPALVMKTLLYVTYTRR